MLSLKTEKNTLLKAQSYCQISLKPILKLGFNVLLPYANDFPILVG